MSLFNEDLLRAPAINIWSRASLCCESLSVHWTCSAPSLASVYPLDANSFPHTQPPPWYRGHKNTTPNSKAINVEPNFSDHGLGTWI